MNSMSRGYSNQYRENYYKKEEEKFPTIIKCGCPSTVQLPVVTVGTSNVTIASLTLNTSCICDPVIKLDFSSAFTSTVALVTGGISLQVFKQCSNQITPTPVGPTWPVVGLLGTALLLAGAIYPSFTICDSDSCQNEDCCTYTVVATISGIVGATVGAAFNNSSLSAVVTCKQSCQKCR